MLAVNLIRDSAGGATGASQTLRWSLSVSTIWLAFWRSENATLLRLSSVLRILADLQKTYRVPLLLASLGELIPSALLNLGTADVSKADLRFIEPFARCGTGVLGTMVSSLDTCKYPAAYLAV